MGVWIIVDSDWTIDFEQTELECFEQNKARHEAHQVMKKQGKEKGDNTCGFCFVGNNTTHKVGLGLTEGGHKLVQLFLNKLIAVRQNQREEVELL